VYTCVCECSDAVQPRVASSDFNHLDLCSMYHVCPMCDQECDDVDALQLHVNAHFDDAFESDNGEFLCLICVCPCFM